MPKVRPKISKKNQYSLSPHAFYSAYHYALQYNEWKTEYKDLFGIKAMDYSTDKVSSGSVGNPTASLGAKAALLSDKIELINSVVRKVAPDIEKWLLRAVTSENMSYNYLRTVLDIPCGKDYYYKKRRQFYYVLSEELNKWGRQKPLQTE